jgi:hypothetical protein
VCEILDGIKRHAEGCVRYWIASTDIRGCVRYRGIKRHAWVYEMFTSTDIREYVRYRGIKRHAWVYKIRIAYESLAKSASLLGKRSQKCRRIVRGMLDILKAELI